MSVPGPSAGITEVTTASAATAAPAPVEEDKFALSDAQKEFLKRVKADNSRIQYEQDNPKKFGTMSWDRYERYKVASSVAEMMELGGKWADFLFDYSRGYIFIPQGGRYARFQSEAGGKPAE